MISDRFGCVAAAGDTDGERADRNIIVWRLI